MRKLLLPVLGAGALTLAAPAAFAQSIYAPPARFGDPPSPAAQRDMHQGAPETNGSSSVAWDRYGAHADGFPNIRLANAGGVAVEWNRQDSPARREARVAREIRQARQDRGYRVGGHD